MYYCTTNYRTIYAVIQLARHRRLLRWEVAGACSLVAVCFGAGVMMRRRVSDYMFGKVGEQSVLIGEG